MIVDHYRVFDHYISLINSLLSYNFNFCAYVVFFLPSITKHELSFGQVRSPLAAHCNLAVIKL